MKDYPKAKNSKTTSIGGWAMTILFTNIPLLGILISIFTLFSKNKNKRNYAAALLIMLLVLIVLLICAYFALRELKADLFLNIMGPIRDLWLNIFKKAIPFGI